MGPDGPCSKEKFGCKSWRLCVRVYTEYGKQLMSPPVSIMNAMRLPNISSAIFHGSESSNFTSPTIKVDMLSLSSVSCETSIFRMRKVLQHTAVFYRTFYSLFLELGSKADACSSTWLPMWLISCWCGMSLLFSRVLRAFLVMLSRIVNGISWLRYPMCLHIHFNLFRLARILWLFLESNWLLTVILRAFSVR